MTYVLSQKGKRLIQLNGYTYSATRAIGAKVRWKCSTHQHRGCYASIHTVDDEVVKINENHDHQPNQLKHMVPYPVKYKNIVKE